MTALSPERPRVSPWVLSAFWFGTAFHWLLLLLILMPANVVTFVGDERKGTYLGLLAGIGAIMALVLPPLVGAHSDRTGKRLPYLKLGLGVNLAGLGVMALAVTLVPGLPGFWVYLLGFLLVQFGNNYATAPYSALIPELVRPEARGRYSGVMAMLQALGQLLAAVSAFAVGALHLPVLASFVLIAAMLFVPALVTLRGVPEPDTVVARDPHAPTLSWQQLFAHQPFLWVFVTRVLFALGQYSVQPFLQYYNKDVLRQSDPGTSTSIMLACIIVGSIASALVGGRISDRIGRKPVIYVAGSVMAGAALLLLVAPSFGAALALALAFGLGYGAFSSVDWALGSDAMPSQSSFARDMGIWHVAFVGPQMTSAPQGALLDWGNAQGGNLGYTLVFGIAALFFVLGVVLVRNVPERAHARAAA
ncbi:MFS transporter [Deinococcus sp. HMF7620]|uniref:MFS transporter n=1 Tax=Deinococcus arboris TaxID=2682977 RepID=A0A7C9HQJ3_9DEIO|nr:MULTISPECIES: MFS transporter [Deinococcus]MBZ9749322.1 MFS transporter [Deinococcus betulae]MVN86212.1 MFS transporter [Deinococcus arboris]